MADAPFDTPGNPLVEAVARQLFELEEAAVTLGQTRWNWASVPQHLREMWLAKAEHAIQAVRGAEAAVPRPGDAPKQTRAERIICALRGASLSTMPDRGSAMVAMSEAADFIERQAAALNRLARMAQEVANAE